MSLLTRLWLCALLAMLMALAGSFVVSVRTARDYQTQQLFAQASDSAAALALSMSQQSKDPAMAELLVTALFDTGHFERIAYRDVKGNVLVERHNQTSLGNAPEWFAHLLPINAEPGRAQVTDGWKQAGVVELQASTQYAYGALWQGTLKLAGTLAGIGIFLAFLIRMLVLWLKGPLHVMVNQARAIGDRQFVTAPEPAVPELRIVARAMNEMVLRVKTMFAEQAARIDELRQDANRDVQTGFANREYFMGLLRAQLDDENSPPRGALCVIRLIDLAGINRRLGRARGDALVLACAQVLKEFSIEGMELHRVRLGGAEFALMLESANEDLAADVARLMSSFELLYQRQLTDASPVACIGWTMFRPGERVADVMTRIDAAVMRAEASAPHWHCVDAESATGVMSGDAWRDTVERALSLRAFEAVSYPVVRTDGSLLHQELMLRLVTESGEHIPAGQFVPAMARQGREAELDLIAVDLAIARLAKSAEDIAINIAASSLQNPAFVDACRLRVAAVGSKASRLWLEVSEATLTNAAGLAGLAALSAALRPFGCRIGVEHFGRHFSAMPSLHDIRVDYVKLDGAFVANINAHVGNQRFVKAVVGVAESLDIRVIAERVATREEWDTLQGLDVYGITGPAVTRSV